MVINSQIFISGLILSIISLLAAEGNNITTILNIISNTKKKNICIVSYFNSNPNFEIAFEAYAASYVLINAGEPFAVDDQLTWIPEVYVYATDNLSKYTAALELLYLTWFWNPRALFMISLYEGESASNYAEVSWKYGILFLYIVTNNGTILTYDLFNQSSCGNNTTLQKISREKVSQVLLPLRFNRCPLKILAAKILPYVIDPYDKTNCGYEVKLVREIAIRANLNPIFINHSYPHWGQKERNGSYSYMYKDLYDGKVDLVMGMVVAQSYWFAKDFEGTHMHGLEASHFYVPSAVTVDGWKNFTQVFSATVWITLITSAMVTALAAYFASKTLEDCPVRKNRLQYFIFTTFRMCFSPQHAPSVAYLRFIFTLWCALFLLINTAYQSQLISTLLKPAHEHQIDSVEEVIYSSNLKYGGFDGLVDFFNAAAGKIFKDIKKNWINCTLSSECLNRTAKNRDFAVMKTVKTVAYHLQNDYRRINGEYEIYKLKDYAFVYSICFALRRGSPYIERFNSLLLGLAENGLYNRWVDSIPKPTRRVHSDLMVQLNLHHLKLAFLVLIAGHASAAIIFLAELKTKSRYTRSNRLDVNTG